MNRRVALIALGLACVAALGWIATRLERVTETELTRMSAEARRNPYLAAQRLMIRMGLASREVRTARDLEQLPPRGVLFLPSGRQIFAPAQRARLLAWVERGGHLVVETEAFGTADPLVDALGVQRERAQRVAGGDDRVVFPPSSTPVEVTGLGARQRLAAPGTGVVARVETAWGLQLLQLARGEGLLTVATDLGFAENHRIGRAQHAEFLWRIVRSGPEAREFLVFSRMERLSLWGWLTEHALAVVLSGAALLALWLWHIGPRFGPMAADAPPSRRRLLDHLRASGRFYWRNQGRTRLVEAAREACLARLARAQPGFASLAPAERVAQVAALADVSPAEAARFLEPGEVRRGAEFIALIHTLQQVHARLDGGR
jgi:hypothetical protein